MAKRVRKTYNGWVEEDDEPGCLTTTYGVAVFIFIVIKVGGTSLVSWSWWWLLFPHIPIMVLALTKLGLMN